MRKLVFIFLIILSNFCFSQENMLLKSSDEIKRYVIENYEITNKEPIVQRSGSKSSHIYITDNGIKLSFHIENDKCYFQKIAYPNVKYGEDLIVKLGEMARAHEKFSRKSTDNEYVWIEHVGNNSFEWTVTILSNGSTLVIIKNEFYLK